jgi:hypothetical protein
VEDNKENPMQKLFHLAGDEDAVEVRSIEAAERLIEDLIISDIIHFNSPEDVEKKYEEIFIAIREKLVGIPENVLLEFFSEKEIRRLVKIYEDPLLRRFLTEYTVRLYNEMGLEITSFMENYIVTTIEEEKIRHHAEYHADKEAKN